MSFHIGASKRRARLSRGGKPWQPGGKRKGARSLGRARRLPSRPKGGIPIVRARSALQVGRARLLPSLGGPRSARPQRPLVHWVKARRSRAFPKPLRGCVHPGRAALCAASAAWRSSSRGPTESSPPTTPRHRIPWEGRGRARPGRPQCSILHENPYLFESVKISLAARETIRARRWVHPPFARRPPKAKAADEAAREEREHRGGPGHR